MDNQPTFTSAISGLQFDTKNKISGNTIRLPLLNLIKKEHPNFDATQSIADSELLLYRTKYISNFLESEVDELTLLHKSALQSISNDKSIVNKLQEGEEINNLTYGQKIADKVAAFGGSWTFIIFFFVFILIWIALNGLVFRLIF